MWDVASNGRHLKMKKLIILSLIGIGIYLVLSKREAKAEEVSEIPTTPSATGNSTINMVDQIIKEIEERVASAPAPTPVIAPTPEICKQVKFIAILPFLPMMAAIVMLAPMAARTAVETICGPNLKTIQEKAELRAQAIFSPSKAIFQILD